jgi:hypothetical protein
VESSAKPAHYSSDTTALQRRQPPATAPRPTSSPPDDEQATTRRQVDLLQLHKTGNVLSALPKSAHPGAKKALAEIWGAEDKDHARAAAARFAATYGAKFPKAVAKITDDLDQLLAFYDYPAEHWVHLRTTNPIESTFATVRHRTRVTKGPGSRAAGLAMAFKLIEAAQDRWRGQRTTPGRPRPQRRHLRQRTTRRTTRRDHHPHSRLNDHDPQVLTIAREVLADVTGGEREFRFGELRQHDGLAAPVDPLVWQRHYPVGGLDLLGL